MTFGSANTAKPASAKTTAQTQSYNFFKKNNHQDTPLPQFGGGVVLFCPQTLITRQIRIFMDEKVLHVVYGPSIKGMVKRGLEEMGISADIVYPNYDFSYGYIPKDFSDKELCFALASQYNIGLFDKLKMFVQRDYSIYDKVIVWHGWSSADLFLLYLMSVIVDESLYHVDIRDCEGFMKKHLSENPSDIYPSMGSVCENDISNFNMVSLAKLINGDEKIVYKKEWYRWAKSNSTYRFSDLKDGLIKEYPEDFMDAFILETAKRKSRLFDLAMLVIGENRHLSFATVTMVELRIFQLCYEGKLGISRPLT